MEAFIIGNRGAGNSNSENTTYHFVNENPPNNIGENNDIAITYKLEKYLRTNYNRNSIKLTNWNFQYSDNFELIYKMNQDPGKYGQWPSFMLTPQNGIVLGVNFNFWSNRKCLNIRINNKYTGDGSVSYDSPFDYTNFYKFKYYSRSFTMLKAIDLSALEDSPTTAFTWTPDLANATGGVTDQGVELFITNSNARLDLNFYSLKVTNENNELIHNYIAEGNGIVDTCTNFTINLLENDNSSDAEKFQIISSKKINKYYFKKNNTWIDLSTLAVLE